MTQKHIRRFGAASPAPVWAKSSTIWPSSWTKIVAASPESPTSEVKKWK